MGNISWTRYNVVIMFQIPQKIDVQESTLAIMTEFDEAKNAQIQNFPPIPDPNFPLAVINTPNIDIKLSSTNFSFDLEIDNNKDKFLQIEKTISKVESVIDKGIAKPRGSYRLGIVILGGPTDVSSYKQITQSVYGVEVKDNWMETQFGVRILYRRPIEENKDADFNVWKKIMFDAESGKIGINIDVNSSLRTPIDYLDYKPSEIWKPIKDLVEECINAFTVE